jgi:hypothetical protein
MRISTWMNDESDIRPSRLIKAGDRQYQFTELTKEKYPILPWADIAGACVDPHDDSSIWVATCFTTAAKDNNWGTWVAKVCTRNC